jgi:hypothetical protein
MPIDVLWEQMDWEANPSGPAPTRTLRIVPDERGLVERVLSNLQDGDLPHLRFISHETVTVFHQQHIAQLLSELEVLGTRVREPEATKQLAAVLQLVADANGTMDSLVAFRVRAVGHAVAADGGWCDPEPPRLNRGR